MRTYTGHSRLLPAVRIVAALMVLCVITPRLLVGQTSSGDTTSVNLNSGDYQEPGMNYAVEPYPCWTSVMEFYSYRAHPY